MCIERIYMQNIFVFHHPKNQLVNTSESKLIQKKLKGKKSIALNAPIRKDSSSKNEAKYISYFLF